MANLPNHPKPYPESQMVQAKMAAAHQGAERRSHGTVSTRELGLPLGEAVLGADHAGAPFDGIGSPGSSAGGFARDHGGGMLVDKDHAGGLAIGFADFLTTAYSSTGVLTSDMAAPYTSTGVLTRDMAAPFSGIGILPRDVMATPVSNTGVLARDMAAPNTGLGAPYSIAGDFARDMAAPYSSGRGVIAREHGVPFEKAQGMAAAGAAQAPQVSIDVVMDAKACESMAAKAAAGIDACHARGSNLASAVVGITAASSAVTMVAAGAVSPPVAFGLFVLMIAGLALAASPVRRG
uniref:Uncharacterized protein n=1 Tax=Oryza punctata TaxID=4537 RepID=A0A0E0LRY8_ORYPU